MHAAGAAHPALPEAPYLAAVQAGLLERMRCRLALTELSFSGLLGWIRLWQSAGAAAAEPPGRVLRGRPSEQAAD